MVLIRTNGARLSKWLTNQAANLPTLAYRLLKRLASWRSEDTSDQDHRSRSKHAPVPGCPASSNRNKLTQPGILSGPLKIYLATNEPNPSAHLAGADLLYSTVLSLPRLRQRARGRSPAGYEHHRTLNRNNRALGFISLGFSIP